jgi:hypothetical protein
VGREHKRLIARIEKLERRLVAVNGSQHGVLDFLAAQSIDDFDRAKKLVAFSGLDVDGLLAKLGRRSPSGQGGPFIAASPNTVATVAVPAVLGAIDHQLDRWEALGALIAWLPFTAPTDNYYVASRFGKRHDSINRRWAMHYGVDLAGVYRSPVRATAPGVVAKVGWNGTGVWWRSTMVSAFAPVTAICAVFSANVGRRSDSVARSGKWGTPGVPREPTFIIKFRSMESRKTRRSSWS